MTVDQKKRREGTRTEDKKTEERKDSKEVIANGEKLKYESPSVMELGELARGSGDCVSGSIVIDSCVGGTTIAPACSTGGILNVICSMGSGVVD
jgi:hypothetical protein